jgi:hypothetical protein
MVELGLEDPFQESSTTYNFCAFAPLREKEIKDIG